MRPARSAGLLVFTVALAGCVMSGPAAPSPYGREATLRLRGEVFSWPPAELLAVNRDTIWVWRAGSVAPFAWRDVTVVTMPRHKFGGARTLGYAALAGGLTGLALGAEATAYGGNGAAFLAAPMMALVFVVGGLIPALLDSYSSRFHFTGAEWEQMRQYARFPQGMPAHLPHQ